MILEVVEILIKNPMIYNDEVDSAFNSKIILDQNNISNKSENKKPKDNSCKC